MFGAKFAVVLLAIFLMSCTRPQGENKGVSISVPNLNGGNSALVSGQLAHVAINISGVSKPIYFSWDARSNGISQTAPTSFGPFDVKVGESGLIQVLAVYKDSNDAMLFTYGESTTSFQNESTEVAITLADIATSAVAEGQVSGRYLTSANSGPTGIIDVYFKPPGRKSLIIEKSFMASGWFSVFMLSGVEMEYKITVDGVTTDLFGAPTVNLNSSQFVPAMGAPKVARSVVPLHVRNSHGSTKQIEQPGIYVWGYWGKTGVDLSTKKICDQMFTGVFTNVFGYVNPPAGASTPLALVELTGSAFPTVEAIKNPASPLASVYTKGGMKDTACVNATGITSQLFPIKKPMVDGNGKDSAAGFRNIFKQAGSHDVFNYTPVGNSLTITGAVLPGISDVFSSIKFYKRTLGAGESDFHIDNPDCAKVALDGVKFPFVGEASSISGDGTFTATVGIDTADPNYNDGKISIVACGSTSSKLADVGYFTNLHGGGGGPSGPYLRIELSNAQTAGDDYVTTVGQCYPVSYKLYQSSGGGMASPFVATASVNISGFNPGSTWYSIYTDSSCTSPHSSGSVVIAQGSSATSGSMYFKPTSVGPDQEFVHSITSSDNINFQSSMNQVSVNSPVITVSGPSIMINALASPAPQMCYEFIIERRESGGQSYNAGTINVDFALGTDYKVYTSHADCLSDTGGQTGNSSVSITSGLSSATMHLKRLGTSVANIPISFVSAGYTGGLLNITGSNSSMLAAKFIISPVMPLQIGACNAAVISHVNSQGAEIPVQVYTSVAMKSNKPDIKFYPNSSCTYPSSNTDFYPGQARQLVYFKGSNFSSFDIVASLGPISGTSGAINLTPPLNANQPYVSFAVPNIRSTTLGSHEFPKVIPLSVSAGATVACEKADGPSYGSWSACTTQFNTGTNTFTWEAADAVADRAFKFTSSKNGWLNDQYFYPKQHYSHSGQIFTVLDCGVVLPPDIGDGFDDIATAFGSHNVVCLNTGNYAGGSVIVPAANKKLIGKTDAGGNAASALIPVDGGSALSIPDNFTLANVKVLSDAGGAATWPMIYVTGTSGIFDSINNTYVTDDYHSSAIGKVGAITLNSVGDFFDIDGRTAMAYGVDVYCGGLCGIVDLKRPTFKLQSSTGTFYSVGLAVYQSGINFNIDGAKFDPVHRDGTLVLADQTSSDPAVNVTILNSVLTFSGPSNINRYPIHLKELGSLTITNSGFVNSMPQPLIKSTQSAVAQMSMNLSNSQFVNMSDINTIYINASTAQTLITDKVHFLRAGVGGTASSVVSSGGTQTWNMFGDYAHPTTYICGISSGTKFAAGATPAVGGNYNSYTMTITNTADPTNLVCQ